MSRKDEFEERALPTGAYSYTLGCICDHGHEKITRTGAVQSDYQLSLEGLLYIQLRLTDAED